MNKHGAALVEGAGNPTRVNVAKVDDGKWQPKKHDACSRARRHPHSGGCRYARLKSLDESRSGLR